MVNENGPAYEGENTQKEGEEPADKQSNPAPAAPPKRRSIDMIYLRYKVLPKVVYFVVQLAFILPLLIQNSDYLT
jgi:hypothetical protein